VFSILGFVKESLRITPDYSMPLRDIYLAVIKKEVSERAPGEHFDLKLTNEHAIFMWRLWKRLELFAEDVLREFTVFKRVLVDRFKEMWCPTPGLRQKIDLAKIEVWVRWFVR
jgi:hypothetical protein